VETTQGENYNVGVVRWFAVMAVIYLALGSLVGVYIAAELAWPAINFDISYLTFGRLHPLHVHLVIFAFGGCALMAAAYYSVQQTCGVRLWSNRLGWVGFWSWNLIMIYTVATVLFGPLHTTAEHAALVGRIEIAGALVWATFILNFLTTIITRKTGHIYLSNWFFLGMMVMIIGLYLAYGSSIPMAPNDTFTSLIGIQHLGRDHSLVLFLMTVGFLGALYYFLPQQISRPIYSNRLAIIHFWVLMIGCVWLGIHYQNYVTPPHWIGSLGGVVSKAIFLSILGAVINGVMTLSGNWNKLRSDYILRFLILSLVFYALSNFLNPFAPLNMADGLSSYTDWTVGTRHSGALGWIAMVGCGAIYHMVEKLWNTRMYSARLVNLHFWLFCIGAIIYSLSMYIAGIMQGLMWRAYDEYGNLAYTFAESIEAMHPYYIMRTIGGILFCAGIVFMLYNSIMTIRQATGQRKNDTEAAGPP
jgi:cytochrome c oxidase cbb3-type subunit 1